MIVSAYYGMMRIGELAQGDHPVKALDVHLGTNKKKILFMLRDSKTHTRGDKPQLIKITGTENSQLQAGYPEQLCPFTILQEFRDVRPTCVDLIHEPFFVYADRTPVIPAQIRKVLNMILKKLNLNESVYSFHMLCSG